MQNFHVRKQISRWEGVGLGMGLSKKGQLKEIFGTGHCSASCLQCWLCDYLSGLT